MVAMVIIGCATEVADNFLLFYLMFHSENETSALLCFVVTIGAVYVFEFSGLFIWPFILSMCVQLITPMLPKRSVRRAIKPGPQQSSSSHERQI